MELTELKILLVEDEFLIAAAEKMELEKKGYAVTHAGSGESAVRSILDEGLLFDIILMDIDLGHGIDGTQAAMRILEKKDIPILFLSSHIEPEIVEKTEKITSYGYVVKNSGIVVLDASVKMALKLFRAKMENKKSSDDLKQKNSEIEGFFTTALDLLCVGDNNGNFKRLNPQWEKVLGYPLHEITGKNFIDFVHSDEKQETIQAVSSLLENNKSMDFTNRFRCKDGTYRWIEWRSIPHENSVYASARDITEHKRVEDEIRNLKSFYANILDSVVNGVLVTDKEDRIIYSNKSMINIIGISAKNFLGNRIFSDFSEEILHTFKAQYMESKKTLSFINYEEISVKTSDQRDISLSGWLLPRIDNGLYSGMIFTAEDVTEHKKIVEKLRVSEDKFSKIFLMNPSIMSISSIKEGIFVDVNNAFLKTFGYERDEVIGKTSKDIDIFEDYSLRDIIIDEIREKGFINGFDVQARTKNNSIRHGLFSAYSLEIYGEKYLLSVIVDITERMNAENKLRDQKNRLNCILQGTNAGTWEWNVRTGKTIFNERWAEMLGFSLSEISPVSIKTWEKFCHPEDLKEANKVLQSCFDGLSDFYVCEYRMKHKNGKWIWIIDRGKVMTKTKDDKPEWMFGTHLDITESKLADEKMKKQLAEKDLLLREIHHRVKNNIILMETILSLQSAYSKNPETISVIQNIISRIQSMHILYDKLQFSKDFHHLSIKSYIESLMDTLQIIQGSRRNITVVGYISEFDISSKKMVSIGIIINELLSNAYKYAFTENKPGQLSLSISKNENLVSLIIQDNGVGYNDNKQSTGLGLSIVRLLVEQLNGSMDILSDHGTKINIKFEV
ncbi:MAG: PAS domain S-box protein [Spirochaetales bacterium]|nr:PAS domain S-box protein [Spirochaetales bacterium]